MVNSSQLLIQLGPLDPAFKGNPQQFATHMVQRMRIVSPSGIVSFVVGDTEPLFNAGPFLKGGTAWWVWDETQKKYIPLDITDTALATTVINLLAQLANLIDVNGALKDGTVWRSSVLADRVVTQPKLHWNSVFYGTATGPDTYDLALKNSDGSSPIPPTLGDGVNSSFAVFAIIQGTNTAAVPTLRINGGTAYPIVKGLGVPLVAGDLADGRVCLMVFDGTSFQVVGDILPPVSATPTTVVRKIMSVGVANDIVVVYLDASHGWQTYKLNDWVISTSIFASLNPSGQMVSFNPGTYDVQAMANLAGVCMMRVRLRDVTNGVTLAEGVNVGAAAHNAYNISAGLFGRFTIGTALPLPTVELQYAVTGSGGDSGSPVCPTSTPPGPENTGDEIYAVVRFTKIA